MKILVTGGAGFIGSNFIHYWLQKHPHDQIVNLDALTYAGNLANLKSIQDSPNYQFIKGDITDLVVVQTALQGVKVVVHFAAESHVDRSIKDPALFLRTNILGTQVLLDAARQAGVERFHHISTDEVYGSLDLEGKEKFSESSPYQPNSPYAASKASADLLVRAYYHTYALPVTISNCSNNYGAYQFPEKLIPLMILNAQADQPLPVYGDGANVRDWIHVIDHCRAIELILNRGKVGETYCVGGESERSNLQVVQTILSLLKKPESLIQFVKDRPGHDRRYAISNAKIEQELGFRPQYSFEEGLAQTVAWYQEHAQWCEQVKSQAYQRYYQEQYANR